ncbi:MAG: hypothetical protein AB1473_12335 [Thermodesulfobacteriota bacterium]
MSLAELEARVPVERPDGGALVQTGPTYGEYLSCIEHAVVQNFSQVAGITAQKVGLPVANPTSIQIVTEKHGSDYHPARVRVLMEEGFVSFVMNVALTEHGRSRLEREFQVIDNLNRRFGPRFLPEVFLLMSDVTLREAESLWPVSMFLGEWLDGYHEFHLAAAEQGSPPRMVLWDMDNGYRICSAHEASEIYRQAAYILSYYYNPNTYEEIYPWHHASGDFVVQSSSTGVHVRLITARQYATRSEFPAGSPEDRLEALWAFFANLTIRMRLDRLDGVGDVVWAGDHCLEATIRGFSENLRHKAASGRIDTELYEVFTARAVRMSPADLACVFRETVDSYDQTAPEMPIIRQHLVDHIFQAHQLLELLPQKPRNGVRWPNEKGM